MFDQRYFVEQDPDMITRINEAFPEKVVHPQFIEEGKDANVTLTEKANVTITFISEGAGFKNSFGYYTFDRDENGEPILSSRSENIQIFDNASAKFAGGELVTGDTVHLGLFPAGTNIGFYLIADGFNGGTLTYWSIGAEANPDGLRHTAAVFDLDSQTTFFGFEDLYNGGDKDYNDMLFTVESDPWTAIDRTNYANTDSIYPGKIFSRCQSCCPTC